MTRTVPLLLAAAAAATCLTGAATAYEPTLWCLHHRECPYPCQWIGARNTPSAICVPPTDFIPVPPGA